MAPPPSKFNKSSSNEREVESNHLWVGNLSPETNDSDLKELFTKYGAIDSVATYSSRNFAFVYFRRIQDAKAAKDALQGTTVRGSPIKIEFARPAKPCKNLWVGGIGPTVSKEELEDEFLKFGKVADFRFLRDRNTAYVEYYRFEDASQAMKKMTGKRIGGEQIRVDFLRSQPARREQWPSSHDPMDGPFSGRGFGSSDTLPAYRGQHTQSSVGHKVEGQPSKILWIGYPPSVQIDENMLHNAMILFGEIEKIKSYPSRHYSFVEFRSVDEARRAKEGLQGRLFNDPRITLMYSSSDFAPGKDFHAPYSGMDGPRPEGFFSDPAFRPTQMELIGHNQPVRPTNFSGPPQSGGFRPNMPVRSYGAHGSSDPMLPPPEFKSFHGMQDANSNSLIEPNWRRRPPSPAMRSSPAEGIRQPMRQAPGSWDVYDTNQFQRDSKRSRIDSSLFDGATIPPRRIDDRGLEASYGPGSLTGTGASGTFINGPERSQLSPVGAKVVAGGPSLGNSGKDYIWRGIIAKGGTTVCRARCIPIGKGIDAALPEVVNCSARTGLDMLTKHYADAVGFDVVFFLPDSERDFHSYTEFLHYLGSKDRAGVAKFDDGMTLFLVPPSDFLTKVLKVVGPERLYGVVLKMPQQLTHSAQPVERQSILPPHVDYRVTRREEQVLAGDHSRFAHEDVKVPPKPPVLNASQTSLPQSTPLSYGLNSGTALSQAGVNLTPELIASLASLLPPKTQSSVSEGTQLLPPSSTVMASVLQPVPPSNVPSQGWNRGTQASDSSNNQPILNYPYAASFAAQMDNGNAQIQESTVGLVQQGTESSRPLVNFVIPSQGVNMAATPPVNQQYQFEAPLNTQKGFGMMHGGDASMLYGSSVFQQPNNHSALSNQVNFSQSQNVLPVSSGQPSLEQMNHIQQLQSVLSGTSQGTSETEVDKNQRYQSTLQFAASLLNQLQNQPQGQGIGNQL